MNRWELYETTGWRAASGTLSRALKAALKGKTKSLEGREAAFEEWYAVADTLRKFGATDTEPRGHAQEAINKALAGCPFCVTAGQYRPGAKCEMHR